MKVRTIAARSLFQLLGSSGRGSVIVDLLLAMIGALVFSIGLSYYFAYILIRPLHQMAEAAVSVSSGDYQQITSETDLSAVKYLIHNFNLMIAQVQSSQTALRDFIANASPELKTPLTSIQGFAQALLDGAAQDKAKRDWVAEIIFTEAQRLHNLIEDLLDLARIDAGHIVIGKILLQLTVLLDAMLDKLSTQAAMKNITLNRYYQSLPNAVGDGDRLVQVFTNLIDNAIKHSPSSGVITIRGATEVVALNVEKKAFAKIIIADSGPGIEANELPRIFERLYQADKSRKRGQGIGLGLTIAYNIAKAHGGEIQVTSVVGQGTLFIVYLPTREADVTSLSGADRAILGRYLGLEIK